MSARWLLLGTAIFSLGMAPTQSAAASPPPITGFFYEDDVGSPIAGALVALYKTDDGEIVGSTFSTNSGAFTLPGVGAPANLFIVATKDATSRRLDVDYDPGKPARTLLIGAPRHGLAAAVLWYAMGKLEAFIGLALGFVFGFFNKGYQDRRLFQFQFAVLAPIRQGILEEHLKLRSIITDAGVGDLGNERKQELQSEYGEHAKKISLLIDDWEKSKADVSVVYNRRKKRGLDDLRVLQQAIRDIKRFSEKNPAEVLFAMSQREIEEQLKPFVALHECKLF